MDKVRKLYIETYGCQMNFSDSEIVASILEENGLGQTDNIDDADIIFLNTCSIRDNAEKKIWNRLQHLNAYKKKKPGLMIGILGCMAERLQEEILQRASYVDVIAGPDSYRSLPELLKNVDSGQKGVNTILSQEETYAGIQPVRIHSNGVSAFISIMRGCENFCSYCVVPYTRGKERSRDPQTIMGEATALFEKGYREVTLLGQNVNSYSFEDDSGSWDFPRLMDAVAEIDPALRLRFATSHPKDMSDELLRVMARHANICRSIHLPVQSGSDAVLKRMNRKYTRDWYMGRIHAIKQYLPDCAISTDLISGFCGETEEDHQYTLSLMREVGYDFAFMFKYSEREGTAAYKQLDDDVPEKVKGRRLEEVIAVQQELSLESNKTDVGSVCEVLVEGPSKRDPEKVMGRNSRNKVVVLQANGVKAGDYVLVKIVSSTAATLMGEIIE